MITRSLIVALVFIFARNTFAQNIVSNGNFEAGTASWSSWFDGSTGYSGSFQTTTTNPYNGSQSGEVTINTIGTAQEAHKIMIKNTGFILQAGVEYNVSFYLKASSNQTFLVQVHQDGSPYTNYYYQNYNATTSWQQFSFSFTSPVTTSDVRFALKLGGSVANYQFDDLVISPSTTANDIISPDYSMDWTKAGRPGGIPNIPTAINVTDYGAVGNGTTDNRTAFQNAINAASYGEAVFIPAGDYRLNGNITLPSGVVLRGECPSNTFLRFNLGANDHCIDVVIYQYGSFTNVSSGLNKGDNVITVANAANFVVGGYAELQQDNDPVLMYTDTEWNQTWAASSVGQMFRITAKNGNQLTLDRPLYINYNPAMNPEMRPIGLKTDVGVENLYIEKLDATDGHTIQFKNAARCWVRNVESNMTYRTHVSLNRAIDCSIVDNYFHHSHDYGGGGHGYGVDCIIHTTSCLIENNIFERLRHAMMVHVGATGNVFGYNYSTDPHWSISNSNTPADISLHGHYPTMNLFEGNIVQEPTFADHWGPSGPGNTLFRNRVESDNIYVMDHSHNCNIIANEMTGGNNSINIEQSVNNTWLRSNNVNGTIQNPTTATIPASLYKTSTPDFLADLAFPAFGPDVPLGANTIDAKVRYDANQEMLLCHCDPQVACYNAGEYDVNIKLYLEGAFDQGQGKLSTDLYNRGLLPGQTPVDQTVTPVPAGQPFQGAPWNYAGTEGAGFTDADYDFVDASGNTVLPVDWVLVSFRTQTGASSEVGKTAAILLEDGSIRFLVDRSFFESLPANVYVLIEHRNHLAAMSATTIPTTSGAFVYDFTASNSLIVGGVGVGSKSLTSGVWGLFGGDSSQDQDGTGYDINGLDNQLWNTDNGNFNIYLPADYNLDGEVNGDDKILWSLNNGVFSTLER